MSNISLKLIYEGKFAEMLDPKVLAECRDLYDKTVGRLAIYGRSQVTLIPHNPDPHKAECATV